MATAFSVTSLNPLVEGGRVNELIVEHKTYTILAALVVSDTIAMCTLPANHIVVDCLLTSDDLDTDGSPAIVLDVGVIGGDTDALIDGATIAQGAGMQRMNAIAGIRLAASTSDRSIGVTVQVAPATGATTGQIDLILISRVASLDD